VPHTLLLADDSITIQRVIQLTFADEDVDVVAVSDGDKAIARIDERPPDIVLADVGMPGKNGYEVAAYVKHTARLAHIPVLLLTGAFEPVDHQRASEAGCDGVLAKPFEPQMVIGRVKELLARQGGESVPKTATLEVSPTPKATPQLPAPAVAAAGARAAALDTLSDFFDKLDAAFANLSSSEAATGSDIDAPPLAPGPGVGSRRADPVPAPVIDQTPAASLQHATAMESSEATPAPLPALPALADAFAALLAVEQNPAHQVPAKPGSTDVLVERVADRVLERLSDRVVREMAAEIVAKVAERLVREEIEKIKATIK
jgi:CheY-like chemotaxis protein